MAQLAVSKVQGCKFIGHGALALGILAHEKPANATCCSIWQQVTMSAILPNVPMWALRHASPCPLSQDKSWRVRYNVAQQVPALCEVLGEELARTELLPPFVRLLRDSEAEVRAAASSNIAAVCRLLPVDQVGVGKCGRAGVHALCDGRSSLKSSGGSM